MVVVPVGVALLVTDTRDRCSRGRREAWHTFFSPSKRPIATLEEEQTCRWRTTVERLARHWSCRGEVRMLQHASWRDVRRATRRARAPREREGRICGPLTSDDKLRSSPGVHKCSR